VSRASAVTAARAAGIDPMQDTETPGAPGARNPGRLRTLLIMVIVGAAIAAVPFLLDSSPANFTRFDPGTGSGIRPEVGKPAPDLAGITTDGQSFTLASLKGHPVWLTFGASWCIDCRAEAPDLQATAAKYRAAGLVVVGVFVQEDKSAVQSYAARVGFDFTMIPDPAASLARQYRAMGFPTHYFITPDGVIKEVRLGGLPVTEMEKMVESILP